MDLLDLLKRPEGKTLEFKRDLSSPDGVMRSLVAFANTSGGTVLIGVEDRTRHVRGVTNPIRAIVQSLRAALPGLDSKVYEMAAHALDDSVRFYDANPAPIEVWLSPEGFPTRVVLEQDADHSQGTGKVDAHFSRFNEVIITPPTEFIPLSTPTP